MADNPFEELANEPLDVNTMAPEDFGANPFEQFVGQEDEENPFAALSEYTEAPVEPPPEGDDSSFMGNVARMAAGRASALGAGAVELGTAFLDRMGTFEALSNTGKLFGVDFSSAEQTLKDVAQSGRDAQIDYFGYDPNRNSWEDLKKDFSGESGAGFWETVGNTVAFGGEQFLGSLPDMVGVVAALPAYVTARTGEIGLDRANADGRDELTAEDVAIGGATSVAVALLERFGVEKIVGANAGLKAISSKGYARNMAERGGIGLISEGSTEFAQEALEYTGISLGTEEGFQFAQMVDQALAGMVGGAVGGGAAGTIAGAAGKYAADAKVGAIDKELNDAMERLARVQAEAERIAAEENLDPLETEAVKAEAAGRMREEIMAERLAKRQEEYEAAEAAREEERFREAEYQRQLQAGEETQAIAEEQQRQEETGESRAPTLGDTQPALAELKAKMEADRVEEKRAPVRKKIAEEKARKKVDKDLKTAREQKLLENKSPDFEVDAAGTVDKPGRRKAPPTGDEQLAGAPEDAGIRTKLPIKIGKQSAERDFVNRFYEEGAMRNPLNPNEVISPDNKVKTHLSAFQGGVRIHSIESMAPGEGAASRELARLTKMADKDGVTLTLSAKPIGSEGLTKPQLVKWYQRHGFAGPADSMARPPAARLSPSGEALSEEQLAAEKERMAVDKAAGETPLKPSELKVERRFGEGLRVALETLDGMTRTGKRANGSTWKTTMQGVDYGFIRGTTGMDGDQVDAFVNTAEDADYSKVYVIDQVDQNTGGFDEHKAMLGFASEQEAVRAYKRQYQKGWSVGPVTEMAASEFETWVRDGNKKAPLQHAAELSSEADFEAVVERYTRKRGKKPRVQLAKTTADGVSITMEDTQRMVDDDDIDITVRMTDAAGRTVGFVEATEYPGAGVLQIHLSQVNQEFRGRGHALEMYNALLERAYQKGYDLESDFSVSADARRVYEAMERRGAEVIQDPEAEEGSRGQLVSPEYGAPVFRVRPSKIRLSLQDLEGAWVEDAVSDLEAHFDSIVSAVSDVVQSLPGLGTMGTDVVVINNPMGLPIETLEAVADAAGVDPESAMLANDLSTVRGLYDVTNDKIYIFSDANGSPEVALETLLHEGVAHKGLKVLFGNRLPGLLDLVWEKGNRKAILRKAKEYGLTGNLNDTDAAKMLEVDDRGRWVAVEEYIAELAETLQEPSIARRVLDAVRQILRQLGILSSWTDNDILALLRDVRKELRYTPLDRIVLSDEFELEDTGEVVQVEMTADVMLRRLDKRMNVLEKLKGCLAA